MAGDWIKVEMNTPDKPELRHIARVCGVSLGEAFIAWFRLWSYFDRETASGDVANLTAADCDDVARLPGIGNALSVNGGCGWIVFHATGASIVNWDRHNGKSAKKRVMTNRRVSRWRERDAPV